MSAVSAMRVAPTTHRTTDRLRAAWQGGTAVVQRAAVAALVTSLVVGVTATGGWPVQGSTAFVGMVFVGAALVDVHEHRLPNRLLQLAAAGVLAGWATAFDGRLVARSLAGALVAGGALLVVHLGRGVGMGDVKMAAVVGASAGTIALVAAPIAIVVAALTASAYGALARRSSVALGPALWFGWVAAVASASAGWWT
ncbi:MAG: Type leader peptidase family, partial [Actinomycetota bacterium]